MTLWNVPGMGVIDDQAQALPEYGEMRLPNGETLTWGTPGITQVGNYGNAAQYGDTRFQWDPAAQVMQGDLQQTSPGYVTALLGLRERVRQGQAQPYEVEQYRQWEEQARAIPTRDLASLTAGWQGEREGRWGEGGWQAGAQDWWTRLDPGSPDVGPIMLQLADKLERGQASPQERQLFQQVYGMGADWDYRATVPQASDAFSPLGDNFFSALGILGIGATGGLAAAPLAAGGASLATTLGSLGTLSGIAGTGAGVLGQALDQPWLARAGTLLGAVGGLAGGVGGLANLWGTGVQSLSDAARLAQSASRITGALGTASGSDALRQASRYLGQAGQLGTIASGVLPTSVTDWSGTNAPVAADIAPQTGVQNLLSAADPWSSQGQAVATQRGGGGGMEWDYSWDYGDANPAGAPYDDWSWNYGGDTRVPESFLSWDDPYGPGSSGDLNFTGEGSGNWLSTLGSLGSSALGFLGRNSGVLGPLLSGAGGLASGALGANASNEAARLQAAALNRGLDLQTAQWLQQQANQAPWLAAGQQALPQLQQLAGQGQPTFQQPGLPGTQPFQYSGPGMPGQGFQYTGAGMPSTGFQYTGPGMPDTGFQYTNQMPTQDFKAPTWEELQARDPGIAARLTEARNALEASALARGSGMSGATLGALQRQSQTLASQEYAPAYQRALGEYQMGYGQDWQRQQEAYQRALGQNQQLYGRQYQQQADLYGRQLAENQLGYNRQWQQQDTDYQRQLAQNQLLYGRGMEQYRQGYGEQAALNQQDYTRNQALYNQQYQQMMDAYNAQRQGQNTAWNQYAALAGLGQTAVGQLGTAGQNAANQQATLLGQLGSAQGIGTLGAAANWNRGIGGVTNNISDFLAGLNR